MNNKLEIKTSKWTAMLDVLIYEIFVVIGTIIVFYIIKYCGKKYYDDFNDQFLYSLLLLPIIDILKNLIKKIIYPFTVKAEIDGKYIIVESGFYNKFIDKMEIKNIENQEYNTSLIGKKRGYETIIIRNYGSFIEIPYVINHKEVSSIIESKRHN